MHWYNVHVFKKVEFNKGILRYKIVNGMCPDYLPEIFTSQTSEFFDTSENVYSET